MPRSGLISFPDDLLSDDSSFYGRFHLPSALFVPISQVTRTQRLNMRKS